MFSSIRIILMFATVISTCMSVSETAVICINLSSTGSKPQPVRSELKRHSVTCSCAMHTQQHRQPASSRLRRRHSRDGNRQVRKPGNPRHTGRSRNSEMRRGAFQENSPRDCKKSNRPASPGDATCRTARCLGAIDRSGHRARRLRCKLAAAATVAVRCVMRLSKPCDASGYRPHRSARNTRIFLTNR